MTRREAGSVEAMRAQLNLEKADPEQEAEQFQRAS
jgi:hypothetical protein